MSDNRIIKPEVYVQILPGTPTKLGPPLMTWDDLRAVSQTYEDIWERDGRWLMGRRMLADIVNHWRDNELLIANDPATSAVNISPSLPTMRDEISGEDRSIYEWIPEELRALFAARCDLALGWRFPSYEPGLKEFLGHPLTEHSKAMIRTVLRSVEQQARAGEIAGVLASGRCSVRRPIPEGAFMSNRSMLEFNHDFAPRDVDDLNTLRWARRIIDYLRGGDPKALPEGVTFFGRRHHSDPCPLGTPPNGWDNERAPR